MSNPTEPEPGARHVWLNVFCRHLEQIALGRCAADVLTALPSKGAAAKGPMGVVTLPMWRWVLPEVPPGKKGLSRDGERLLLPLRLLWDCPLVDVIPPATTGHRIGWEASGYGYVGSGAVTVESSGTRTTGVARLHPVDADDLLEGATLHVAVSQRRIVVAALDELVTGGKAAWWGASEMLEPWVEQSLVKARSRVSADLGKQPGVHGRRVLVSDTTLDSLASDMWLGTRESPGSVERLLSRCLQHDFAKVDPMLYVRHWLRRDAEAAIRRTIGDSKYGSKVRRLAETGDFSTNEDLLAAYRRTYPGDPVGISRVARAMAPTPDPMAECDALSERLGHQ